jgi:hypothetical protein
MKERMPGWVIVLLVVVVVVVLLAEAESLMDRLSTAWFSGVSPGASPR